MARTCPGNFVQIGLQTRKLFNKQCYGQKEEEETLATSVFINRYLCSGAIY